MFLYLSCAYHGLIIRPTPCSCKKWMFDTGERQ